MKQFVVYKFTNKSNGKIYIGKTSGKLKIRVYNHIADARNGKQTIFARALRKYGLEGFDIEIIFEGKSDEEILGKEREFIAKFKSNNSRFGYNLTDGGEGQVPGLFTRKRLSKIIKSHYEIPGRREKQFGQNNGRSVLTEIQVRVMRLLYWRKIKTRRQLSSLFSSVGATQIELILKRTNWRHLPKMIEEGGEFWDRELAKLTFLTADQKIEVRKMRENGMYQHDIAKHFNCAQSYIGKILKQQ